MRKDLGGQSDSDTLSTLRQEQWELHGKCYGLIGRAVVGLLPRGDAVAVDSFVGESRELRLDVSACSSGVTGEDIPPVPLRIDEEALLSELDEGIIDRGVTVGVVLHRLPDDVSYLDELAAIHPLEVVEDTALHGLEPVIDMGYSTLEDDVGGVVEEPCLVHLRQVAQLRAVRQALCRLVGGGLFVLDNRLGRHLGDLLLFVVVLYIHMLSISVLYAGKDTELPASFLGKRPHRPVSYPDLTHPVKSHRPHLSRTKRRGRYAIREGTGYQLLAEE